jgi:hemolysin D
MQPDKPALPVSRRAVDRQAAIRRRSRQALTNLTELPEPGEGWGGDDRDFLPAALEVIQTPPPFKVTLQVYLLCGALVAALAASIFFHLTTYAVAPGKIVAAGQTKVIEPRDSGQISAIRANDGDRVERGDILVELNAADAVATRAMIVDKLVSLRGEASRRHVEITAARTDPVQIDPAIAWDANISQKVREREEGVLRSDMTQLAAAILELVAQRKVKETTRDSLSASIAAEKSLITATTEHTGMHQQLEAMGWDSHALVLQALEPLKEQLVDLANLEGGFADAAASIPVIESRIAKAREVFVADDVRKLAIVDRQIEDLALQLTKADATVANMTLRSPIAGTVHASQATSKGQVVKPGQLLMEVVPEGAPLEVVAYVLNTDIGFVRDGQTVDIKIDTFPYTRYGTIEGTVTRVANDAISGAAALSQQKNGSLPPSQGAQSATTAAQTTSDLVFPVGVALSKATITVDGKDTPLSPGMSVVAEIATGNRRVISYIMYPLVRGAPQHQSD